MHTHLDAVSSQQSTVSPPVTMPKLGGTTYQTHDIDEVRSHVSEVLHPHQIRVRGSSSVNFRHNRGKLKNITFNAMDYGLVDGSVTVDVPPMESSFLAHFSLSGRCEVSAGRSTICVPSGAFTILSPYERLKVRMSHDYQQLSVRIPRQLIEHVLRQEMGFQPHEPIKFSPIVYPSQTGSFALRRLVETICSDFADTLPGVTHARVAGSLEDCFVRLMLATLEHNYSAEMEALGSAPPPAPFYVRRAEEFIRMNATEQITVADLVQAAGVSPRSLHAGFKRFRQISPMAYLRNHRLELARKKLKAAAVTNQSVTDIAMDCGFNHLSKFARDYDNRFGEKPSRTRLKYSHSAPFTHETTTGTNR